MDDDTERNLIPGTETNLSTDLQAHQRRPIETSAREYHEHAEDVEDPQPFSSSEHAQLNRRRGSDAATLRTLPRQQLMGSISVDRSRVNVGETVGVIWDVSGRRVDGAGGNHNDFLGLFEVTEGAAPVDADNLLDSRLRGFNSSQSGRINWAIQSDHLHGRTGVEVCFCYFDHQHTLRAQSATFTIVNPRPENTNSHHVAAAHSGQTPFEIQVYDLQCSNLRSKLFGAPDPFLKLHVTCHRGGAKLPHHSQKSSTEALYGTINPRWTERLTFRVLPSDVLEITVRDKFTANRPAISHFLGRAKVQLSEFLQHGGARTLTFDLQKRLPSDKISGKITLTVENNFLPPNPSTSDGGHEETQQATDGEVIIREGTGTPVNVPHLHPSALLRISRLASLSSEDSISISDVPAADFTSPQEVGGTTPNGDGSEAVSINNRINDDVVMVGDNSSGGQSSETSTIVHVQTGETAATAESAAAAVGSGSETSKGGAGAMVTMEMTSSEPNEPLVTNGHNSGHLVQGDGEKTMPPSNTPHKKRKSSDTLDRIRTTLYGSSRRLPASGGKRRSHTVLSRHVSLRVPPSHDDSTHNLIQSQKLSGSISMFQLHTDLANETTESLPPNWEVRSGASGMPVYYDHENKVVRLDRPVDGTGEASPRISDFVRRANLNLLQRQPSLPPVTDPSNDSSSSLGRSNTISGPGDDRVRGRPRYRWDANLVQQAKPESRSQATDNKVERDQTASAQIVSGTEQKPEADDNKERESSVDGATDTRIVSEKPEAGGSKKEKESSVDGASESTIVNVPLLQVSAAEVEESGTELLPKGSAESDRVDTAFTSTNGSLEEKAVEQQISSVEVEDETVKSKVDDNGRGEEASSDRHSEDTPHSLVRTRTESVEESVRQSPGFCFITRPDLYKFAKEVGNEEFFKNLAVLELIQTIRSDHTLFTKYQHSSKLVKVINSFALTERDLPSGWEKRVDPNSKRHVFIDHNSRQTTYIDPRLPYPGNKLTVAMETEQTGVVSRSRPYVSEESDGLRPQQRPRLPSSFTLSSAEEPRITRHSSVSALSRLHVEPLSPTPFSEVPHPPTQQQSPVPSVERQSSESSYSERVVTFLRQPGIFTLLRSRYEETVSYNLRAAIESIQREGVPALERMQRDLDTLYLDLTIILSLFDEEISHFTFPVSSTTAPGDTEGGGGLPGLSPDSSRQQLLSSLSSTSSEVHFTPLNLDLNGQVERVGQQSTIDRDNHTFGGIPIDYIIDFFRQPNIYHHVLSRYNGISADDREFIEWFQRTNRRAAEDRLGCTTALRTFVDGLRTRIDEFVASSHPDSAHTSSMGGASPRDSQRPPPEIENHMLAGMTMEQILTFFRNAEERERVLAPDVLMPVMSELSVDELEELLTEDATVRSVVMRYQDEIIERPFPTITQIKNFFRQPNIYSTITALNVTSITLEDRATVERIISTHAEILSERLLWDRNMRRFISNLSSAILQYDIELPPTNRRVSPAPQPPPPSQATPTPQLRPLSSRSKKQEFIEKLRELQRKLEQGGYGDPDESQNANFGRESLLADAYQFVMGSSAKDLRRRRLNVHWGREEGLDYGGPQREFFFNLSRQLFNPYHGLFEYSASGSYTVQISHLSANIGDALQWFRFAGRLIGYAIIQGQLLDVFFARHVYKALLGSNYTVSDVEAIDIPFYNSLKYVLENDPEPLDLTFTVLEETFGEVTEYELKPGGTFIPVIADNKQEYVDLMVRWKLSNGIGPQTESIVKGLREMIPRQYLSSFDAQELEWVIAGTPEINLDDWKNNTIYWGGYHKAHHIIQWFWQIVEAYSTEQKLRLLQFVTGTSSIPFEGFRALRGSNSLQKFTIDRKSGARDVIFTLPIAHTCFNRIDLPDYPSIEMLAEKLTLAIEECGTFENA